MADHESYQAAADLLAQVMATDFPNLTLYDHQKTAVINRLAFGWESGYFSVFLAGDVGTGKTMFYLVYLRCVRYWYRMHNRPEAEYPSLAIVPAKIKQQWWDEALRFGNLETLGPLAYIRVEGPQERRNALLARYPALFEGTLELLIINYALARRKTEQQILQGMKFLCVVVDEAHRIKNSGALQTIATKSLDCQCMITGSGTMMTKSPADLWSILHAMNPGPPFMRKGYVVWPKPIKGVCPYSGSRQDYWFDHYNKAKSGCYHCSRYGDGDRCDGHTPHDKGVPVRRRRRSPIWGTYESFVRRYCRTELVHAGGGRWVTKITGAKNLGDLRTRLRPHMVRWRRGEVLDLPELHFQHVLLDWPPAGSQLRMYATLRAGFIEALSPGGAWGPVQLSSALARLIYLRRACCLSPRAFSEHLLKRDHEEELPPWVKSALKMRGVDNAKLDWLEEFLEENVYPGHAQAMIYSNWTTTTREIRDRLRRSHSVTTGYFTGETSGPQDKHTKRAWNDGMIDVVIGSPAISEGLNFQGAGRPTVYVIIFDLPWTPLGIIQAIGRVYRSEQESDVEVIFLGMNDTIEQWMCERVQQRQRWIVEVLDGSRDAGSVQLFNIQTRRELIDAL